MPRPTKSVPVSTSSSFMKTLSRYESEISSILGMLVVAALAVFIFLFIKKFMPKPSISPLAENTEQREDLLKKEAAGTYTVKSGQGLSQIAQEVYQDGRKWKLIADANNIKPPYMLTQGQVLNVPEAKESVAAVEPTEAAETATIAKTEVAPAPAAAPEKLNAPAAETKVPQGDNYVVVTGDSLWKIAEAQYGTGYAWVKIYQANKELIGKNPGLIYAGTSLVMPKE